MGLKESKTRGEKAVLAALGTGQPWENSTCASSVGEAWSLQPCRALWRHSLMEMMALRGNGKAGKVTAPIPAGWKALEQSQLGSE